MDTTRGRLVAATNELFRRRGYNGTALKQIIEAARASTGSLYHFFPGGKVELTEAVIRETGASYLELFDLIAAGTADPAEAVGAFFDGAAETLEQSDYIDLCPIGTIAREVASTDERLRGAVDDVFASWCQGLGHTFQAAGLAPTDAVALAAATIAALEGGFILARTRRDGDLLRQIGREVRHAVGTRLHEASVRAPTRP